MRNQQRQSLCSLAALAAGLLLLHANAAEIPGQVSRPDGRSADQTKKLKVFILAGQSIRPTASPAASTSTANGWRISFATCAGI